MATSDDTGQYIGNSDLAQPEDGDFVVKGAAEIRQVKTQVKNTFPNFAGEAVTATEAELSALDGVTGVVETRLDALESAAAGQVSGPVSSVDGSVPVFDGVTGAILRDGGKLLADLAEAAVVNAALALKAPIDNPDFTTNARLAGANLATQAWVLAQGYINGIPADSIGHTDIGWGTIVAGTAVAGFPSTWTVPEGIYMVWASNNVSWGVEAYLSGSWRETNDQSNEIRCLVSNGSNMRLRATNSTTYYYVRLGG